jgi:hypothetical protein
LSLLRDGQLICPPSRMRLVLCDVSAEGGVDCVLGLSNLESRTNLRGHAADKGQSVVGERTRGSGSVALADEVRHPANESALQHTFF